jgi:hypothetical protein
MNNNTISRHVDENPLDQYLDEAEKGSRAAYGCAWAKVIQAKKTYYQVRTTMTRAECDTFWRTIMAATDRLGKIKKQHGF